MPQAIAVQTLAVSIPQAPLALTPLPVVTIAATDATAGETVAGIVANPGLVTLTRTGDLTKGLTVKYGWSGTAASGTDCDALTGMVTFAAGASKATVNVKPKDDLIAESTEILTISLVASSNSTYSLGTATSATVKILDNETPVITLATTDATAGETATGITANPGGFRLTRLGNLANALTVSYTLTGTAINSTDYTAIPLTATFTAGSNIATVNIAPKNDTTAEAIETAILTLATGTGYSLGTATSATVKILDNETPLVTVTATDASAGERATGLAANPGVFTLTRLGNLANALTVNYGLSGTAVKGIDYSNLLGTVTFAANSATATVTIKPLDDGTSESSETAILTVLVGTGYGLGAAKTATVTILDNDVSVVTVGATDAIATETAAGLTADPGVFTLTRLGNLASALTVNYVLSGTATNGVDYGSLLTSVTFAASAATATVTVNPTKDNLSEPDEKVTLTLATGLTYSLGTAKAATVTIKDTAIVSIAANRPKIGESFYVYNGHTYLLTTTPKTWEEAQVEAQQYGGNLVTINDAAEEQWLQSNFGTAESFWIGLTDKVIEGNFVWINGEPVTYTNWYPNEPNNSGGNEDYTHMNVAGKWNDNSGSVMFRGIIEVPSIQGQLTLTRTGSTSAVLTVNYTVSGTATNGTDYTNFGGTATFAAGSSTATINVNPLSDNVLENNETVTVTLTPNNAYQLGTAITANLAIIDNTTYPTQGYLNFDGVDDYLEIPHSNSLSLSAFTVETWVKVTGNQNNWLPIITKESSSCVERNYGLFIHLTTHKIHYSFMNSAGNKWLSYNSNTAINLNEWNQIAMTYNGSNLNLYINGLLDSSQAITDAPFISSNPIKIGGGMPIYSQFIGQIDEVRIWNVARAQAEIQANFKRELQGNESGLVGYWKLNGNANDWTSNQNHGSLRNNPTWYNERLNAITITANDANVSEANNPGQFTLTRTGDLANSLTVYYSVSGTATNGTDYNALTGFATFAAGSSTALVNINPIDDPVYELNETVTLTLATNGNYNINNANSATVTIADNDLTTITINANDPNAAEPSDGGQFTLNRTGSVANALTVYYSIGGSASNGTDYSSLSGNITFAAGSSSATINVSTTDDTVYEGNENVILTVAGNSNYNLGSTSSATVAITDNDTSYLISVNNLVSNQEYYKGWSITTANGYKLIFQTDGNLVNYSPSGSPLWATGTYADAEKLVFQLDGNLVLYNTSGKAIWATNTDGYRGKIFAFQDDGNLVIYDDSYHPLFARTPGVFNAASLWQNSSGPPNPNYTYRDIDYLNTLYQDNVSNQVSQSATAHGGPIDSVDGDDGKTYALVGGEVIEAKNGTEIFGRTKVFADWGYNGTVAIYNSVLNKTFIYWHFAEGSINEGLKGQTILAGSLIGTQGNTGYSFGSHVHVEVHSGRQTVDMSNPSSPRAPGNATKLYLPDVFQEAVRNGLVKLFS